MSELISVAEYFGDDDLHIEARVDGVLVKYLADGGHFENGKEHIKVLTQNDDGSMREVKGPVNPKGKHALTITMRFGEDVPDESLLDQANESGTES